MYKNKYVQNKIIKNNLISYKIEYLTNLNNFKLNNNLKNCFPVQRTGTIQFGQKNMKEKFLVFFKTYPT